MKLILSFGWRSRRGAVPALPSQKSSKIPFRTLSYPVILLPPNAGVCANGTSTSFGTEPFSFAFLMKAFRSSPITSAMQVVETEIILGLYMLYALASPSIMLLSPPNTAGSSVIDDDTQELGSLKWREKWLR